MNIGSIRGLVQCSKPAKRSQLRTTTKVNLGKGCKSPNRETLPLSLPGLEPAAPLAEYDGLHREARSTDLGTGRYFLCSPISLGPAASEMHQPMSERAI